MADGGRVMPLTLWECLICALIAVSGRAVDVWVLGLVLLAFWHVIAWAFNRMKESRRG